MYGGETGGSQGAFAGGGFMASPGNGENAQGSQGQKRNAKGDAVLPFTVKAMHELLESGNAGLDDNVMYFGQEVHNVTIVGKLKAVQEVSTHASYKIHDGTGSIDVRFYNENKDEGGGGQAALTEGSYVRVFGHLRAFQGKKMVVAINIRPVADPNEITFHLLEVIYCRERLKGKGGLKGTPGAGAAAGAAPYSTPAAAAGGYGAGAYGAPAQAQTGAATGGSNGSLVQELVGYFDGSVGAQRGENGIGFAELMSLTGGKVPADILRKTLDNMMTEGMIFTTVDESHFKSTNQ